MDGSSPEGETQIPPMPDIKDTEKLEVWMKANIKRPPLGYNDMTHPDGTHLSLSEQIDAFIRQFIDVIEFRKQRNTPEEIYETLKQSLLNHIHPANPISEEKPVPSQGQELKPVKSLEGFFVSLSQEISNVDFRKPAMALLLVENPTNPDQALEAARKVSSPTDIIGSLEEGGYGIIAVNTQPMGAVQKALQLSDISPDLIIGVRIFHPRTDAESISGFYNRATKALGEARASEKIVISVHNIQQVPIKKFTPQDQTRITVTSKHT